MAKQKVGPKNLHEQEITFDPVPYETTDVRTSIALLSSVEKHIVVRALNTLAKYSDQKDLNVAYLYNNGIISKLLDLIVYNDTTILRFALKLLAQLATFVADAALELSCEQHNTAVKQIAYLFMTSPDTFVKEFCAQILAHVIKTPPMASSLLKLGIIVTVFSVLAKTEDPDTQYNTLKLLFNILEAREASIVIPNVAEFSARTLLCYLTHQIVEIRTEAINIIEKLTTWKSKRMQDLLREEKVIEKLFHIILNEGYKTLHKKAFNVILTCIQCVETATYFVKSLEFVEFCQWVKTCPKIHIYPSSTILTALTREPTLKQTLFDFSVEDSILSFFRTPNELVFFKVCEAISNMSSHSYCCQKIVTPVVVNCVLEMLHRKHVAIIPYHEVAHATILNLLKRNAKTMDYVVGCGGVQPLTEALLRDKEEYTSGGLYNLMYILYIFSSSISHNLTMMNPQLYKMLLDRFEEGSDCSSLALLILDRYIDAAEYRQYFVEFNGPRRILTVLTSTPSEVLLKNTLLHLQRIFVYKKIGMEFLWMDGIKILEHFTDEVKEEIPLINELITMMYNLYLPLKFFKLGRLDITDQLTSRFHMVKGSCKEFPFLEILNRLRASTRNTIYVVDFSADVTDLTRRNIEKTEVDALSTKSRKSSLAKLKTSRQSSILRKTSRLQYRSSISIDLQESGQLTCSVPPPITFGFLSEDPYLPQYVYTLKKKIYENENHVLCFEHQIKELATFVHDRLSGPPHPGNESTQKHCMDVHVAALREKLGTNLIPLGYLRYGFHCEKALLFKALADKLHIPASLVKGQKIGKNNLIYWNEVPIMCEEQYENAEENLRTYMAYAVVDLMDDIGDLMLVDSVKAAKYCGFLEKEEAFKENPLLTLDAVLEQA